MTSRAWGRTRKFCCWPEAVSRSSRHPASAATAARRIPSTARSLRSRRSLGDCIARSAARRERPAGSRIRDEVADRLRRERAPHFFSYQRSSCTGDNRCRQKVISSKPRLRTSSRTQQQHDAVSAPVRKSTASRVLIFERGRRYDDDDDDDTDDDDTTTTIVMNTH